MRAAYDMGGHLPPLLTMQALLLILSAYSLKPNRAGGTSGCLGGLVTSCTSAAGVAPQRRLSRCC